MLINSLYSYPVTLLYSGDEVQGADDQRQINAAELTIIEKRPVRLNSLVDLSAREWATRRFSSFDLRMQKELLSDIIICHLIIFEKTWPKLAVDNRLLPLDPIRKEEGISAQQPQQQSNSNSGLQETKSSKTQADSHHARSKE